MPIIFHYVQNGSNSDKQVPGAQSRPGGCQVAVPSRGGVDSREQVNAVQGHWARITKNHGDEIDTQKKSIIN